MSLIRKIKGVLHVIMTMAKEEKVQPIIAPTDKEKLFEGKVALIAGGKSEIGMAIAKTIQNSSAKVIFSGSKQERFDKALTKWGDS